MKKALSVIFALAIFFTMLPVQSFGAKENTVDFYGNSIPAGIRALRITRYQNQNGEYNGKYYVPSETPLDCELLAEKFPDLYVLELNDGCIENTGSLSKLKNLAELKLTCKDDMGENFSDLSFLEGMKNLHSLYIYNDKRVDIDISALENLTNLTELYLNFLWPYEYRDYRMFDISPLEKLTKIKELTLYFETEDISPLKNMTELQSLDIVSDSLSDGFEVLHDMPKLEYLRLYGANISDAKQLSGLKQLKSLELSECWFYPEEALNGITELKNLEELEMCYYYGSCIPYYERIDTEPIAKLTNLKSLTMRGCYLPKLDFVKNLTNLETLSLIENSVKDISGIENLSELKYLSLGRNEIKNISPIKELTNLEELEISQNYKSFKTLPLKKLKNLKELDLSYSNDITDFSFLGNLNNLEYLNIYCTDWSYSQKSRAYVETFIENHPHCEVKK